MKIVVLFILLGFAAYANVLSYPFVHDDVTFIKENPNIHKIDDFSSFIKPVVSFQNDFSIANFYYRPLLELYYRIEYQLFRFNVWGYHLTNILIHIANAILILILLSKFMRQISSKIHNKEILMIVSILFLIHPVQSESVACISGISNLMYTFLCLSSFLFYINARQMKGLGSKYMYVLSSLFYFLSLFAKEQSVVLFGLIILYEYCLGEFHGAIKKDLLARIGIFLLVTLVYFSWRKFGLGVVFPDIVSNQHEFVLRILAIPRTLLLYFRILLFPFDLHYYRSVDLLIRDGGAGVFLLTLLFIGIYFIGRFIDKGRRQLFVFGLGWFVITIIPVLNIVPLIHEYSFVAAFEHFLYLPLVGFFLSIFVAADFFCERCVPLIRKRPIKAGKSIIKLFIIIVAFLCLTLTVRQNKFWRNDVSLFERVIKFEKKFGRAYILLGKAYYFNAQYPKAVESFSTALKIMNSYVEVVQDSRVLDVYFTFIKDIHFDLAHCFEAQGRYLDSVDQYKKILEISPHDDVIHNSLGTAYIKVDDLTGAMRHFKRSIEINPENLMAKTNLATCFLILGDTERAKDLFMDVLKSDSQFSPAKESLNRLLKQ